MPEWRSKGDDAVDFVHDGPARTVRGTPCRDDGAARSPPSPRQAAAPLVSARHRPPCRRAENLPRSMAGSPGPRSGSYAVRPMLRGLAGRRATRPGPEDSGEEPVGPGAGAGGDRDGAAAGPGRHQRGPGAGGGRGVAEQRDGGDGASLTRAITRAQAKNQILRNVSALTGAPPGTRGRPSHSMTSPRRPR